MCERSGNETRNKPAQGKCVLALPLWFARSPSLSLGGDETLTLLSQISCSDGDATSASPFARSASHSDSDSITPPQLRFMTVQNKFSHSHALSHSHPTTLARSLTRCRWLVLICCCCFCCCCLRRRRCCRWCYCSCRAFDILSLCLTFFALCGCFVCVPVRVCMCTNDNVIEVTVCSAVCLYVNV